MSIADDASPAVPWEDSAGSQGDIEPLAPVERPDAWSPEEDDLVGVLQSARKLSFGAMDEG